MVAQQSVISGTVTDESGQPLPGVTVVVKGTTQGTVTNGDGNYSLANIPEDATLVFSFVGMLTQEIEVSNKTSIDVQMKVDAIGIEEVVAIGYGTAKKRDLTGAVSTINLEDIQKGGASNFSDLLRGNVAGLDVSRSFEPDEGGVMIIRGISSLGASNEPLIVLDGMLYYGKMIDINPNDIERIDVLKDASSAAIYGARSANGVILITTKKGKTDKPTINLNSSIGWVTRSNTAERLYDPAGFVQWRTDAFISNQPKVSQPGFYNNPNNLPEGVTVNDWLAYTAASPDSDIEAVWLGRIGMKTKEIQNYKEGKTVDWMEKTYQTGITQDYNISLSGSTPKVSYYWSLGYANNEGVVINDWFKTIRSRLNLEGNVNKYIKVGINTQYSDQDQSDRSVDNFPYRFSPYSDFYEADGITLAQTPTEGGDWHSWLNYQFVKPYVKTKNILSKIYADINLPYGFTFSSSWTNRFMFNKNYYHQSSEDPRVPFGRAERRESSEYHWFIDNILKWNMTFNDKHTFDVTLLQNAEEFQSWYSTMYGQQFEPNDDLGFHNMGSAAVQTISSNDEKSTADALMARLNYNFASKYMLTGSWRRDGYSAFGQKYPRADFWSVAGGWIISEEKFYSNKWLPYIKLRTSYGTNGNREIGRYTALAKMGAYKMVISENGTLRYTTTLTVNEMENADLKWESTASLNFGLDFNLNSNISGTVDVYSKKTNDLLIPRALPSVTGYTRVMSNLGEIQNRGMEFSLNASVINNSNFKWQATANLSLNRNQINSLYGIIDPDTGKELDDVTNGWYIGESLYRIYGYKVIGVWQQDEKDMAAKYGRRPGDFKVEDVNGDGNLTPLDYQEQGFYEPRFRWSLRNGFNLYKNFDISFLIYSYWGHRAGDPSRMMGNISYFKQSNWVGNYWTPENSTNEYAGLNYNGPGLIVDKSFIRLDNITLAYSIPKNLTSRIGVSNLKTSILVRNPYVWTKQWNWWDPESGINLAPSDLIPENRIVPVTNFEFNINITI
jgi:TonB-dependent starch-binding outer membrane protein SusC